MLKKPPIILLLLLLLLSINSYSLETYNALISSNFTVSSESKEPIDNLKDGDLNTNTTRTIPVSQYYAGEGLITYLNDWDESQLFTGSVFYGSSGPGYYPSKPSKCDIGFDFGEPVIANKIRWTNTGWDGHNIKTFEWYGSNDSSSWNLLGSYESILPTSSQSWTEYYTFNTSLYRYYRFKADTNNWQCVISEMDIILDNI